MYTKILALSALAAAVQGGILGGDYSSVYSTSFSTAHANPYPDVAHRYVAPIVAQSYAPVVSHNTDYYAYPKYEFSYGVKDPHTGDSKSQHEERDGDVVRGYYTLTEPDGTQRTVHYTADNHNGFNAVVEKSGHAIHPDVYQKNVVAASPVYYHH